MIVSWSFERVGEGTKVTVTAENVPFGISAEDHAAGLASSLQNLAGFVERNEPMPRPPLWDPAQFAATIGFVTASRYTFRPVTQADLSLLACWRAMPHVMEWWGSPETDPEAEKLAEGEVAMWIVAHDERPFAFAQDYSPHDSAPHHFAYLPPGSRGIDQYIGEPDMLARGHGSAFVRLHCDRLFAAGALAVGTDPHPDNRRAIRAYEKAGFAVAAGAVETRWGRALLMERWASTRPDP